MSSLFNFGDIELESSLGERWLFTSMTGSEELGDVFVFTVHLHSITPIKLADTLGSTLAVKLPLALGKQRYFHGHVVSFADAGVSDGYHHYTARLLPWFHLLSYNRNCRIFQDQSTLDIAKTIFNERGFADFKFQLNKQNYRKYEYAVQYRESDFTFISRLLEQEGIYYFFEHEKDKHTLVLADAPDSHKKEQDIGEIEYRPWSQGQAVGRPHLGYWQNQMCVQAGGYVIDDYDFERPRASLASALSAPKPHAHANSEVYEYPGEYLQTAEGDELVRLRLEALHAQHDRITARGNVRELRAGCTFKLSNPPDSEPNAEYLVVGSHYTLEGGGSGSNTTYSCSITVLKREVPFRPERDTPRPAIQGIQTAKVVGRAGDEIHTDKYGRVKVQFPWDRLGTSNENSSCWIRVAQVWAGAGMGHMHVPRVGQEVLVSFLEGDPDRPIITGRVYNGNAKPPFDLPEKAMVSGTKSESTPGGGGYNEISLDDTKGAEKIVVHGQFDMESTIEHDEWRSVGNNRTTEVGVNHEETVGANQTVVVGSNQSTTVGAASTETITLTKALTIGTDYSVNVGATMTEAVTSSKSTVVGAASNEHVKGSKTVKCDHSISESAGDDISINSGKKMALKAGDNLSIHGNKKGVIELTEELTIKVGSATITLKKSGDVVINGKKVSVSGSGDVVIKGKKVAQN